MNGQSVIRVSAMRNLCQVFWRQYLFSVHSILFSVDLITFMFEVVDDQLFQQS